MVARRLLLLVSVLVLLIHDHDPKLFHRRKNRRTRADGHARRTAADAMPLVVPLAFAEVRVQHRDLVPRRSEARLEALDRLRRERDFRHEQNRAEPAFEHALDGLEVDLRLSAAGHTVEQDWFRNMSRLPGGISDFFRVTRLGDFVFRVRFGD